MVYGLLNIKIRDRVHRESIQTFEELICASREAEMFFFEAHPSTINPRDERKGISNTNRCSFCRIKGHTIDTCYKRKKRDERQTGEQQNLSGNQPRQTQQANFVRKPSFSCYGCGAPGVYRSNCGTCNTSGKDSPQYLQFNTISSTVIGHTLPTAHVEFFGIKGEVIFDSGAKTSIASPE